MGQRMVYPRGLAESGRRLWKSMLEGMELETHEELILLEACRTADRLDTLAAAQDGAPLTVKNSKGDEVANPLLVESRQQAIVFSRLVAALRIPGADEVVPQRRQARGAYQPRPLRGVQ